MDIKDILAVGFTAEDFDLLTRGLDSVQPAEGAADIMIDAMMLRSFGKDPNKIARYEAETKARRNRQKSEHERLSEDLVVLKSKLIMLKRLLITNAGVKAANDILNSTPPPSLIFNLTDYQRAV